MSGRDWPENPCPGALGRHPEDETVALFWCALHEGHDGPHKHYDAGTGGCTGWSDEHPDAWHQSKEPVE